MPGTAADLLTVMRVFDNELLVSQAGSKDEARALTALTAAQHHFETLCASRPRILQSTVNVVTAANVETTSWPSELLRVDGIWFLGADGRPVWKVKRIEEVGGHVPSLPWPLTLSSLVTASGSVAAYYGNMADFYWMPLPDGVQSLRIYGLFEKAEFAARTTPFSYPNRCKSAIAAFAAHMLKVGIDDDSEDTGALAGMFYTPLLRSLQKFDRNEPHGMVYTDVHTT